MRAVIMSGSGEPGTRGVIDRGVDPAAGQPGLPKTDGSHMSALYADQTITDNYRGFPWAPAMMDGRISVRLSAWRHSGIPYRREHEAPPMARGRSILRVPAATGSMSITMIFSNLSVRLSEPSPQQWPPVISRPYEAGHRSFLATLDRLAANGPK